MDYIREKHIHQGNLIFMVHRDHLTKSGWWRKVYDNPNGVYYILEKPVHKDYDIDDESLKETHKKDNFFIIKANTINYEQNRGDKNKYQILVSVSGTEVVDLVLHNYDINNLDMLSTNVTFVPKFEEFLKYYNDISKDNIFQLVARNYKV